LSQDAKHSGGVGTVKPRLFSFAEEEPFRLRSGQGIGPVTLAYETYGELNGARDNAVLLFHALSGSQHAAGYCASVPGADGRWTQECQEGWWDGFVGPGKAVDTRRFFVICANYLGGCYGSSGPSSTNPATGAPYGAAFPRLSLADIVDAQVRLLDHLGIQRLHAVIGASLGGIMCLSYATRYPDRVRIVVPIAAGMELTPLQRLHNLEQIIAIERDPGFCGGDYYDGPGPENGLMLARIISHKTFVSLRTLEDRARLTIVSDDRTFASHPVANTLESYMLHQGRKFVQRFDANTYLRIVDAWQNFSLVRDACAGSLDELFARCREQQYLIFSIDSDVCFYPDEQEDIGRVLKEAGVRSMRITVHSEKGHDSFLIEPELFTPHLKHTLEA
jgi:homoserine O-acetyltransferase/O-succinyltransferase